jgi:uncharacterized protein (DUF1697 family)
MKTFIALLRGINVSGHKKIKMAELREQLNKAGLTNVQTYIQSGNIVFNSDQNSTSKLQALIHKTILDGFGFDVPTTLLTLDYLVQANQNNPYSKEAEEKGNQAFITFLSQEPEQERIELLRSIDYSPDVYHIDKTNIYLYCPNGAANSKISNNLFENKLKVSATTRNFKTVWKLIEMASA